MADAIYKFRVSGPVRVAAEFATHAAGDGVYLWEPLSIRDLASDLLPPSEVMDLLVKAIRDEAELRLKFGTIYRKSCPLDFKTLVPMPIELLNDADHVRRKAWFMENWGVECPIRKITYEYSDQKIYLHNDEQPRRKRKGVERRPRRAVRRHLIYTFMSRGAPWPIVRRAMQVYPELYFDLEVVEILPELARLSDGQQARAGVVLDSDDELDYVA